MILESLLERLAQCQYNVQIERDKRHDLYQQWEAQNLIAALAVDAEDKAMQELTKAAIKHRKYGLKPHPAIEVTYTRRRPTYTVHLTPDFEQYRPTEDGEAD